MTSREKAPGEKYVFKRKQFNDLDVREVKLNNLRHMETHHVEIVPAHSEVNELLVLFMDLYMSAKPKHTECKNI